jgi:hypothetical protein
MVGKVWNFCFVFINHYNGQFEFLTVTAILVVCSSSDLPRVRRRLTRHQKKQEAIEFQLTVVVALCIFDSSLYPVANYFIIETFVSYYTVHRYLFTTVGMSKCSYVLRVYANIHPFCVV